MPFDNAQPMEPAANTSMETQNTGRAPNRSATHPEAGIKMASASR